MSEPLSRRSFAAAGVSLVFAADRLTADDRPKPAPPPPPPGPREAPFVRDYPPPAFKPAWKKDQLNRALVQDFVIYAHSDLDMVKRLLDKQPRLLNAAMDWGDGDWETGLGGASHMGRRDIVEFLLARGARIELFCAAMMGRLDAVRSFLTLQPALIESPGPHGLSLHFHA